MAAVLVVGLLVGVLFVASQNFMSPSEAGELAQAYGGAPSRWLSQNFM
jgi:hypothetical protein